MEDDELIAAAEESTSGLTWHNLESGEQQGLSGMTDISDGDGYPGLDFHTSSEEDLPDAMDDDMGDAVSSDEDDDPSPLEYARLHGLTMDYTLEHPRMDLLPPTPESLNFDLADPPSLLNFETLVSRGAPTGRTICDTWDVDRNTAKFLASVIELGHGDDAAYYECDYTTGPKQLKIEEPILARDPALELQRLKERSAVKLSTRHLQVHVEEERTPLWSVEELRLPSQMDQRLAQEKLDVGKDTITYLEDVLKLSTGKDDGLSELEGKQCTTLRPLTPPLLPLLPSPTLFGTSENVADLDFTSSPDDLIAADAAALAQEINERDDSSQPNARPLSVSQNYDNDVCTGYGSPGHSTECSPSPGRRKRMQDLRPEVPLLPVDVERPPKRAKTVQFSDELLAVIPDRMCEDLTHDSGFREDMDLLIAEVLAPNAAPALEQINGEQLVELDTTMRVPIPDIEAVEMFRPWEYLRGQRSSPMLFTTHNDFMSRTKADFCRTQLRWAGVSKIEQALSWTAFPSILGKVKEEEFDDGSFARYMAGLSLDDTIDVDGLISYQSCAENFDGDLDELESVAHEEDNEELRKASTPAVLESSSSISMEIAPGVPKLDAMMNITRKSIDMATLLKRRKLEIEAAGKRRNKTIHERDGVLKRTAGPVSVTDFATIGGLSGFFRLQGDAHQTKQPALSQTPPQTQQQQNVPQALMVEAGAEQSSAVHEAQPTRVVPDLVKIDHAASIVVSSALLGRRDLMRTLQSILPTIEMIERTLLANAGPATSADAHEAHITISPTTGVLVTTLQKLKQKSLPGQVAFFGVHERIASISARYARLIILVSEGQQPPRGTNGTSITAELDHRDCEALADLTGLSTQLTVELEVVHVPGGEAELAMWIAALLSQNLRTPRATTLLPDETMWERFLRRAGMNAFAAQAVLAALKQPGAGPEGGASSMGDTNTGQYGLAAFVQMLADRRIDRLGTVVNSRNIIQRVSNAIEGTWRTE